MKTCFADTAYYLTLLTAREEHHEAAKAYWVQQQAGNQTASNGTYVLQSLAELRLAE